MKIQQVIPLLFLLSYFSFSAISQTVLFEQDFNNGLPTDWTEGGAVNEIPWQLRLTGAANLGQFWSNRQRLDSPSDGGAMVFDSDGYQSNPETQIPFPHRGVLISPIIDIPENQRIGLRFYQYFRNFEASTSVGISTDGGENWQDITLNQNITLGAETSNSNLVFLELSDFLEGRTSLQLRFVFEGSNFFWIIDDIQLLGLPPEFGRTFPPLLGDSLTAWEVPYLVDSLGGAYPPDELAIEWSPTATEGFKDSLRNELQVVAYDTCTCSNLELFHFADTFSIDLTQNLLVNGDFEGGARDFRSELNNNCGNCAAASYCVGTQMTDICPFSATWSSNNFLAFDNPGSNQFLIVDGGNAGADIWCQDVNLDANETYLFAFRGRNLIADNASPQLRLLANGTAVNSTIIDMDASTDWELYFIQWTPTSSGTFTLCLEQINGGLVGYDYGIDDLVLVKDGSVILNIQEKKATADQETDGVQESDYNYYNGDFLDLKDTPAFYGDVYPDLPQLQDNPNEREVVVSILDTGIDYIYKQDIPGVGNIAISPYLKPSSQACYPNDILGWNFVDADDPLRQNKPYDDHSHGTHVAGIMIQNWQAVNDDCCALKILPVKTHNARGLGKLFDVSCAIYYATEEQVDFINASWGFSAVQSPTGGILYNAIEYARDEQDIKVFTSAGNEAVKLDDTPDYPSNYSLTNIFSVAALDSLENLWSASNFSDSWVEYGAIGEGINSAVPPGSIANDFSNFWMPKSGTSMAAPIVTATAAKLFCLDYEDTSLDVIGKLGVLSIDRTDLLPNILDGRTIDMYDLIGNIVDCELLITDLVDLGAEVQLSVFPNPVTNMLTIEVKDTDIEFEQLYIWDALGKLVRQVQLSSQRGDWRKSLDVRDLSKGTYHISLVAEQGVVSRLLLKL